MLASAFTTLGQAHRGLSSKHKPRRSPSHSVSCDLEIEWYPLQYPPEIDRLKATEPFPTVLAWDVCSSGDNVTPWLGCVRHGGRRGHGQATFPKKKKRFQFLFILLGRLASQGPAPVYAGIFGEIKI